MAAKAGVSHATITRFFRNPKLLAPVTYDRVKKVVDEMNYVPNAAARSLFTGRTDIVSLIVPDITSSFYTAMASGAEDVAREQGYTLTLGKSEKILERQRNYLQALISHRVDGIILTPASNSLDDIELLKRHKIPLVLVDRKIEGSEVDTVCGDSKEAGRLLTRHLIQQGFKRIAFVGGESGAWSLEQRLAGYKEELAKENLPEQVHLGNYLPDSGERSVHEIIKADKLPEAIFAASSRVVLGVFKALREHGVQVPSDVAVACVDDVESYSMINPFLTVVEQPSYDIGKKAMENLVKRINGIEDPPNVEILPVKLIVRKSSLRHQ